MLNASISLSLHNIRGNIERNTNILYIHSTLPFFLIFSYTLTSSSSTARNTMKYASAEMVPPSTNTINIVETNILYHLRFFSNNPMIKAPIITTVNNRKKGSPEKKLITTILLNTYGQPCRYYSLVFLLCI